VANFGGGRRGAAKSKAGDVEWNGFFLYRCTRLLSGSPTPATTNPIQSFASEELCNKAVEAVRNELNTPLVANPRADTQARGLPRGQVIEARRAAKALRFAVKSSP
jgi:hypothetical protein